MSTFGSWDWSSDSTHFGSSTSSGTITMINVAAYDWTAHYYDAGYKDGRADGLAVGDTDGYSAAYPVAYSAAYDIGLVNGVREGTDSGMSAGKSAGFDSGWAVAYSPGYDAGFDAGVQAFLFGHYRLAPPTWADASILEVSVPEPNTAALGLLAIFAVAALRRR